ncbi:flagellin [Thermoanaerobacterium thermosulfurigenes]|uniref:flagellin N-terminal helical domain-containing protein n=1 Tax=Thermoanaerobacterium thermosulfurigenes TaxID=33950 RepID=UPI003EF4FFD7
MVINTNLSAINAWRALETNNTNTQKALQKLSSGYRINSAADDAAGLAISEKMKAQIAGLDQAQRNAQDGISLIQTAEGALNETTSILQRMRELAVQASNDTNTAQDRASIQAEMDQLNTEIDRIANTTEFNTKKLLDGSMSGAVTSAVANVNSNTSLKLSGGGNISTSTLLENLADANGNNLGIVSTDQVIVNYAKDGKVYTVSYTVSTGAKISDLQSAITANISIDVNTAGTLLATASSGGTANAIYGLTITVKDSSGNVNTAATNALSAFTETTAAADKATDGKATLQIGANTNQNMQIEIDKMDATALGVKNLQVGTQSQANIAIKVIDNAINKVSTQRATLGAYQNRLEHTINNLGTANENITAAESRIRDVDMAQEMMEFTKDNILNQAATAMLAQANQQPQTVLQLLR